MTMHTNDGRVLDELAIRALTERYSEAITRRDLDAWRTCWTDDAVWHLGPPIDLDVVGVDAILAEVARPLAGFDLFMQMPHSGVIEVTGDRASARWIMHEVATGKGTGALMTIYATYADELVRDDGQWRFTRRAYQVLHLDDPAHVMATVTG